MLHSVITGHIKLIEQSRYLRIIYQTNLRARQAQRQERPAEQSSSDDHRVF